MGILVVQFLPFVLFIQNNYTFGPSIRINDDPSGTHFHATTQRAIACRGDTVYTVWRDDRYEVGLDYNAKIFFSKSMNAGNSWSANLMISHNWDSLGFFLPHMALDDNGNIFVVYCSQSDNDNDRDIYFTKSTNGGITFALPMMVNDSAVVPWQTFCSCAVDSSGQHVYVVWEDGRNPQYDADIYLARSTDGGANFLPSIRINDDSGNYRQWVPVVACNNSGQNVYVAWQDFRDTLYGANVYFSRSADYGQTFEPNYCVNDTATTGIYKQGNPTICYKNSIIYLAWRDERDKYFLYFNKSVNGGVNFETDIPIRDDTLGAGIDPSIAADDSGKIYVVWYDTRTFSATGYDIYFSFSTDSGQTFKSNVRVNDLLGNVSAWDTDPTVAVNQKGSVFVAWDSDRNDPSHMNPDIYFAAAQSGIEEMSQHNIPSTAIQVYPTIFNHSLFIIPMSLDFNQNAHKIQIYDITGRLMKSFNDFDNSILWDGMDEAGSEIPPGIYFVSLSLNNKVLQTKKIVKTKK